jgi:integrase
MASLSTAADGRRTIQFIDVDGKRKSIRLGRTSKREAGAIKLRVEALLNSKIMSTPVDRDTSVWLSGIGGNLAARLAAVGLMAPRANATTRLGEFLDAYIVGRPDIKLRTKWNLEICARRLVEHFGKDRLLSDIKPGDADDWCSMLRAKYANATAARTIKRGKQFFAAALRKELIPRNPFADCKAGHQSNPARSHFVKQEDAALVIQACPDAEWRLIVALCRYGGLRCPTELLALTWPDVDWERNRFRVHASKTEHHKDSGERWVPIFPELRPYLEEAFHLAAEGSLYVVSRYRDTNQNLRTQLARIIRRAGLAPWPKLFHNLRASRETELAAEYPLHVVCAWIGNTAMIAAKHYLQVRETDFERAAKSGAVRCTALQNPVQSVLDREGQERTQPDVGQGFCPSESLPVLSCPSVQIPPRGLEPLS